MKRVAFIVILLSLFLVGRGQEKSYSSKIFDGITFQPLQGVSVYNMSTKKFAFSDKDGRFTIKISKKDTLVFSKSIYRQLVVEVNDKIYYGAEDFFLYYKTTMLKEVRIFAINPSYEGFKKDIVEMKLPDYYERAQDVSLSDFDKANAIYNSNNPGNVLALGGKMTTSPISYLYDKYSHKSKMKQLYNEMQSYEEEVERVQDKYNREIVKELTGLDGEELLNFMMYCRFSYYDLVRWDDETIRSKIKSKYYDYQYNKIINAGYKPLHKKQF
ncbi:MAG: carboxypeptidase-like regulatory domain-containing protein [Bacteroidales bacterium]|nr:carboxypeptidase-like regulatory domain-containing protein [Bacteroidales bacterium]